MTPVSPNAPDVRPRYEMPTFSSRRWISVGKGMLFTEDTPTGAVCVIHIRILGGGLQTSALVIAIEFEKAMHQEVEEPRENEIKKNHWEYGYALLMSCWTGALV